MTLSEAIKLSNYLDACPFDNTDNQTIPIQIRNRLMEVLYRKVIGQDGVLNMGTPLCSINGDASHPLDLLPKEKSALRQHTFYLSGYIDWASALTGGIYDILTIIASIMSTFCVDSIEQITESDIVEYMQECANDIQEVICKYDDEYELFVDDVVSAKNYIYEAVNTGKTDILEIEQLCDIINSYFFNNCLSEEQLLRSFDSLLVSLYSNEGIGRTCYIMEQTELPKYLLHKENFPKNELTEALDRAINVLQEPILVGYHYISPICFCTDQAMYTVFVLDAGEDCYSPNEENMMPFFYLAANIVDILLPEVLAS